MYNQTPVIIHQFWSLAIEKMLGFKKYRIDSTTFEKVWAPLLNERNILVNSVIDYLNKRLLETDEAPGLSDIIKNCKPEQGPEQPVKKQDLREFLQSQSFIEACTYSAKINSVPHLNYHENGRITWRSRKDGGENRAGRNAVMVRGKSYVYYIDDSKLSASKEDTLMLAWPKTHAPVYLKEGTKFGDCLGYVPKGTKRDFLTAVHAPCHAGTLFECYFVVFHHMIDLEKVKGFIEKDPTRQSVEKVEKVASEFMQTRRAGL